ncbi:hypothetical protein CC79DRAFT_1128490 [Sarocladium strictum]
METPIVLVFGGSEESMNSGLQADGRVLAIHNVSSNLISTSSLTRSEHASLFVSADLEDVKEAIARLGSTSHAIKIGTVSSLPCLQIICQFIRLQSQATVVVDAEAIFRIDPPPEQSLVGALITDLLPHTGILFVTVLEALSLLRGAGIPTEHPKGLSDLKSMGHALQRLGATNVVIKTETFDAPDQMTALQYVFCGESGEKMDRDYLYNPSGFFGASYSIPSTVAALMAKGATPAEAVSAGFKLVADMLKEGKFFGEE